MIRRAGAWFAVLLALFAAGSGAQAQEKIRIGVIGPFSGPFATAGTQFRMGIEAFTALHGTKAGNREVELIYRDIAGTNPAVAKRLAEELIVNNKVHLLTGFYLSSEATAVAPVVNETKTPTVLFVASSPAVITQSQYFVRMGGNIWQYALPQAEWGYRKGLRKAYIAVADYAPGHDVQVAFRTRFTDLGGAIVGEDRIPLTTVDFAAYAERIARASPDLVVVFIPAGTPAVNFIKALSGQGVLDKATVIGQAETDDPELRLFDKSVTGVYSALYYAVAVPGEENRRFKEQLIKRYGAGAIPNFTAVDAYDGMRVLYRMIEAQKGTAFSPEAAMAAVRGYAWSSPRGPVRFEGDSRDVTQNIYIRRVTEVGGRLENAIVDTLTAVKTPTKVQRD